MLTFLATFAVFVLVIFGMSLGGWLASSNALFSLPGRVRQRRHPTIPARTSQPSFVYCILIQ